MRGEPTACRPDLGARTSAGSHRLVELASSAASSRGRRCCRSVGASALTRAIARLMSTTSRSSSARTRARDAAALRGLDRRAGRAMRAGRGPPCRRRSTAATPRRCAACGTPAPTRRPPTRPGSAGAGPGGAGRRTARRPSPRGSGARSRSRAAPGAPTGSGRAAPGLAAPCPERSASLPTGRGHRRPRERPLRGRTGARPAPPRGSAAPRSDRGIRRRTGASAPRTSQRRSSRRPSRRPVHRLAVRIADR